jgi:two-component system, cell cycle sensor histidine kinase and response regulator CckA
MVRVLIVDDEQSSRFVIAAILRKAGYETVEVRNGYEALHLLASESDSIALVISDIHIPQMDGLRLLEEIKRRYPTLLVMIVSGRAQSAIEARARGAVSYLPKPFSRHQLLSVVHDVAGHGIATT